MNGRMDLIGGIIRSHVLFLELFSNRCRSLRVNKGHLVRQQESTRCTSKIPVKATDSDISRLGLIIQLRQVRCGAGVEASSSSTSADPHQPGPTQFSGTPTTYLDTPNPYSLRVELLRAFQSARLRQHQISGHDQMQSSDYSAASSPQ